MHAVTIPVKILGVIWLVTFEASMADVHIRRRTIDDVIKRKYCMPSDSVTLVISVRASRYRWVTAGMADGDDNSHISTVAKNP